MLYTVPDESKARSVGDRRSKETVASSSHKISQLRPETARKGQKNM